jgi:hypothetical protein
MTTKHWLGTAAAVLALSTISASAIAQGQSEMRREGERGSPTQASPRETGHSAGGAESRGGAGESRAGGAAERAAPDLKQSAKEGGQSASPATRDQAESREAKPATGQKSAEQPAKNESRSESKSERDQAAQREGRESRDSAKDAAETKQKQGAAEDRKGDNKNDNRATETNKAETNKATQPGQHGDREADRHDRNPTSTTQQSQDERKGRGPEQANDKQPGAERNNQAAQPARPDNTAAQQNAPADARQRDAAGQAQTQTGRGRSSTTISVNDQQRSRVFDQLHRDREFDQARTDLDIRVNVGERLPERVRPRRLPDDIVTVVPEYRGYDYTVVHDEIAIIDPRSREIVDVIPQGGVSADRGYGSSDRTRVVLSDDQRQILRRAATSSSSTVGSTASSSSGSSGPSCLSLQRVPDEIARSNPELASYQYLAIGDQVVLIDPQNQKVVQVIDQQQQQQ